MYRSYENPYHVEEMLRTAERRLSDLRAAGARPDELLDAEMDVNELRERANFAWQDEEEG